jgi:hypothetical protein
MQLRYFHVRICSPLDRQGDIALGRQAFKISIVRAGDGDAQPMLFANERSDWREAYEDVFECSRCHGPYIDPSIRVQWISRIGAVVTCGYFPECQAQEALGYVGNSVVGRHILQIDDQQTIRRA